MLKTQISRLEEKGLEMERKFKTKYPELDSAMLQELCDDIRHHRIILDPDLRGVIDEANKRNGVILAPAPPSRESREG